MMRKLPHFISRLFGILLQMLLDIEDEPAWRTAENEDEDAGESSNYSVGQQCLDRLAIALICNESFTLLSSFIPMGMEAANICIDKEVDSVTSDPNDLLVNDTTSNSGSAESNVSIKGNFNPDIQTTDEVKSV